MFGNKETLRMILLNTAMNKGSLSCLVELFVDISARLKKVEDRLPKVELSEIGENPDV